MRWDHIEKRIYEIFKEYFKEKGFYAETETHFYKKNENIVDYVQFRVVTIGFDFGVIYSIGREYKIIENHWKDLKTQINPNYTGEEYTISLYRTTLKPELEDTSKSHLLRNGGIFLKTEEIEQEMNKLKDTFIDDFENLFMPFLRQTENIHWMDKTLNTDPMDFDEAFKFIPYNTGAFLKKMIVARLASNPKYEDIYQTFKNLFVKFLNNDIDIDIEFHRQFEVLQIIYDRLKDVKPLNNPILV